MSIGEKIKFFREEMGMTQQELADLSGISRVSIGNYERGSRIPNAEVISQIANALEISTSALTDKRQHKLSGFADLLNAFMFGNKKTIEEIANDLETTPGKLESILEGRKPKIYLIRKFVETYAEEEEEEKQKFFATLMLNSGYSLEEVQEEIAARKGTFFNSNEEPERLMRFDRSTIESLEKSRSKHEADKPVFIYLDEEFNGNYVFFSDKYGVFDLKEQKELRKIVQSFFKALHI